MVPSCPSSSSSTLLVFGDCKCSPRTRVDGLVIGLMKLSLEKEVVVLLPESHQIRPSYQSALLVPMTLLVVSAWVLATKEQGFPPGMILGKK